MSTHFRKTAMILFCSIAFAASGAAYVLFSWDWLGDKPRIPFFISTNFMDPPPPGEPQVPFDGGFGDLELAIVAAAEEWNSIAGSEFVLEYKGTTPVDTVGNDGVNVVMLRYGAGACGSAVGAYGCTFPQGIGATALGFDIELWTHSGSLPVYWSTRVQWPSTTDVQGTMTHEFGHVLGLDHSNYVTAVMGTAGGGPGTIGWRHLTTDDIAGAQAKHGPRTPSGFRATRATIGPGETTRLEMRYPGSAGNLYTVFASTSADVGWPMSVYFPPDSRILPVDPPFIDTASQPAVFESFTGTLDSQGRATARYHAPIASTGTLYFSVLVHDVPIDHSTTTFFEVGELARVDVEERTIRRPGAASWGLSSPLSRPARIAHYDFGSQTGAVVHDRSGALDLWLDPGAGSVDWVSDDAGDGVAFGLVYPGPYPAVAECLPGGSQNLAGRVRETGRFTVQVVFRGTGPLLSFANGHQLAGTNLSIESYQSPYSSSGSDESRVQGRLSTSQGVQVRRCRVPWRRDDASVFTLAYDGRWLTAWANGLEMARWRLQGDLSSWDLADFVLGNESDRQSLFDGTLYDVQVWDHALDAVEIAGEATRFLEGSHGLWGYYHDDESLSDLRWARIDREIGFSWNTGGPSNTTVIDANTFSVAWSGFVEPTTSETYTFHTTTDDGVRLWIDGQLLIDEWHDQPTTEHTATIELEAGVLYPLRMEFYEGQGAAEASLSWSTATLEKEIIPNEQLWTDRLELP